MTPSLPSSPGAGTAGYARSWLTQMYLQIRWLWDCGRDGARRRWCSGCTRLVPLSRADRLCVQHELRLDVGFRETPAGRLDRLGIRVHQDVPTAEF